MRPALLVVLLALPACRSPERQTTALDGRLVGRAGSEPYVLPTERCGDYFFVNAEINEQGPFRMLVDTGAEGTLLSPDVGEAIGTTAPAFTSLTDAVGNVSPVDGGARIETLRVGAFERGPCIAVVADLSRSEPATGVIDGVLGMDLLNDCIITFDYRGSQVRVGGEPPDEREGASVCRDVGHRVPTILARFGSTEVPVVVDTGSTAGIAGAPVDSDFSADDVIPVGVNLSHGGVSLRYAMRLGYPVTIGPLRLDSPVITLTRAHPIVGATLFRDSAVTFDRSRMLIRPAPSELFEERGCGFAVDPWTDGWMVGRVFAGTPAEEAGIHEGDVIVELDGRSVHEFTCGRWSALLEHADSVKLTILRDDVQMTIDVGVIDLVP